MWGVEHPSSPTKAAAGPMTLTMQKLFYSFTTISIDYIWISTINKENIDNNW